MIAEPAPPGGEKPLNGFETLTLAPIDRRLIDAKMLTSKEIAWLDGYHAGVAGTLRGLVDTEAGRWLEAATKPLGAKSLGAK